MRYLTVTETAKLVRKTLRARFPGIKFSVRSSSFAGGTAIDVRWTDGPTETEVDGVVAAYRSRGFDSMIDMSFGKTSWLLPDGTAAFASSPGTTGSAGVVAGYDDPPPHPDAERVSFGASFVQTSRDFSFDLEAIERDVCERQRVPYVGHDTRGVFGEHDCRTVDSHVWRLLNRASFPAGTTYAGLTDSTEDWADIAVGPKE